MMVLVMGKAVEMALEVVVVAESAGQRDGQHCYQIVEDGWFQRYLIVGPVKFAVSDVDVCLSMIDTHECRWCKMSGHKRKQQDRP